MHSRRESIRDAMSDSFAESSRMSLQCSVAQRGDRVGHGVRVARVDRGGECRVVRGFGKKCRNSMQCLSRCKRCCARE